ncbi:MAG TPA: biotin-dependent carboxyltransferase family protein [Desulfosporosinus sp.]|nr:biotin-dependent carboxyltransferase family protein [Desulfosporosinus sp.]
MDVTILDGGLMTTIQDKGRTGFQQYGMPVSGAMDDYSMQLGNLLVGNKPHEAVLETTILGPSVQFNVTTRIALTGANMEPQINRQAVTMWRSILVCPGDVLTFGGLISGCRGYIALAGGIGIEAVMGSKSTYVRGAIGGLKGEKLQAGDEFDLSFANKDMSLLPLKRIPLEYLPIYEKACEVRVVLGPQDDCFTQPAIRTFLESEYDVTNEADRMGYRLAGPKLEHIESADIISDGIALGSIQVPGHGIPIIMMSDRQTTGGYTKIATVISPDLAILAQLKPGDKVRFKQVSITTSHEIYHQYKVKMEDIQRHIKNNSFEITSTRLYEVSVKGKPDKKSFKVTVEEINSRR